MSFLEQTYLYSIYVDMQDKNDSDLPGQNDESPMAGKLLCVM